MSVAVVNLGCGNVASMMFALERLGAAAFLTDAADEIGRAERVILPGVGAAAFAMGRIRELGLLSALRNARPLLGVCLGHQLLYEASDEGEVECLGLLEGRASLLPSAPDRPIPHMGWNTLQPVRSDSALLEGVKTGDHVYFVHSFAAPVTAATVATAQYGEVFSAAADQNGVFGCQFHPERSAVPGAQILKNFLSL